MITNGWLDSARQLPSPHCSERSEEEVSLLVIHNISLPPNEFGGDDVCDFFLGKLEVNKHPFYLEIAELRVSSHLYIRRTGEVIQFVPFHLKAWHAGQSEFDGRSDCNQFSIGIELEGADTIDYTQQQYARLADLTKVLQSEYPLITNQRICGHCDISPGRKSDPGPSFDWPHYFNLIQ